MKETLIVPKPHSQKQRLIMEAMFSPGLLEVWIACGTKFGKSVAGSAGICSRAFVKRGGIYRWVAPIYSQTKIGMKYCQRMLPKDLIEVNRGEPSITFPAMDTVIEFKSGKHPEDLEGEAVDGYCLDECAKMNEQVYDSAKTTTTVTRGPIVAFSTPRGKNWFYNKCMTARDEMRWAVKNRVQPTRLFITAPSIDNPAVTKEAVEEARRTLPDRLFRQYYHAEFMDDGSVFIGHRDCVNENMEPIETNGPAGMTSWIHPEASTQKVVIGVDWAKHTDYTVFTAFEYTKNPRRIVGVCRFQGIRYTQAVRELYIFSKQFEDVGIIWHDKTGVGDAIDDLLAQTTLPFFGVVFNNTSKSSLINTLALSFEKKEIELPNWPAMVHELDAYEVIVSETGTMRYNAPQGLHDDIVISMAIGNQAAMEYAGSGYEIRFLEDLPKDKSFLESYYNDIGSEEDDGPGGFFR